MAEDKASAGLNHNDAIPDRLYFKIGEVAQLVGVQGHVLRYWEKEIAMIKPGKSQSNQRRYRRKDVELFREVRRLLHDEHYTLAGVRRQLSEGRDARDVAVEAPVELRPTVIAADPAVKWAAGLNEEAVERLRVGLKELIRMAGEEAS